MSTWNIYHKDGSKLTDVNGEQITVHGLEYSDSWMGECFVTINFKHEVPINFQIGDYIVYRGERFELNYEPGKDKQARPDTYGEGFVYDSVKFNALQDELARAEFLDVVLNDNELHYTALPKFPFYVQTLDDLLDRIQACLNEQIGAGLWKIYSRNKERSVQRGALESEWLSVYGEKTDDNVIESMSITVDSQTCWQALALVNEKWDINFIVRGRNIYVGTTGIQANHIFKYGIGNGLYEIVQNADSDQSVVTRLRAYGSEKNLPSHYYADLGVKYVANITKVVGASTNVTLELDLDYIETYFKNPRKYIVSGETGEQSFGWVLKVTFDFKTEITGYVTQTYDSKKCRFYSELKGTQTDTGDEESKEKLDAFIAQVKAGNTKMYITSGLNKKAVPSSMKEYAKNLPNNMSINRLMLPGFPHVSLSDFYNSLTNEEKRYVNPIGRQHRFSTDPHRPYIDSINIEQIGLRSASQFFDTDDKTNGVIEIYPTIEEMEIGGVRVDEIDKGVAPDDDGRFGDNETVKNVDIYLKKAIDFDINDLKDDDFSISMKDGMCGGRTFKVASSTKIDGRWRLTIERVKDDALELWFPYKDYPIKKGDHFVLTGITLPDSYVNAASLKLLKYAIAFIDKNDYTRYVYQPKVDEIFMARQHDLAEKDTTGVIKSLHDTLKTGDLMEFEDTDLRIGGVISIDQLTIKEEDGKIPTYDITLREDKEVGTIQKIQQQISSLQSGNGGTGAGLTTTQVKSQVATEGSKHFISKINDDTAKGTITWEKVQKFLQGLLVGGGSWTPDAEGRSHLITDYLEVRMKAIFEELVINKTSTIGGKEIISPAGGVVAHKVEEVTGTYNNVSQKAYRCYFLAEQDGDEVDNDFAVGDQVRSESFNVRKGTYHKAGNHFYWRLVIGRDEDPVELEGKKYHYIDLSDTDCATASDVPAKGDVLNQCGNRTDVERQNCLIFSAVDTYSPSISLYHGINSYSFANREYVEYGVNKQTNKAFFHVYGDMYFGDRPTSANNYEGDSYVKYDSDKKKVTIKGDLDIKSTYDGKTLDKYIADKSLDKEAVETIIKKSQTIIDLQNQIDGAIETWFYDGVPTLKNAPAIGWTTDDDKKTHLGDLYYDNKTGKAYRFAKDGSTYKWIIITDTELTKALEDSRQALKDAKSKRRIFGSQPVPPYDVNDMWVNATYPSDGSTYKNEILKCSTAKAEGEKFDIADWKLASKYTDDTKAEEAKKAAEKAQEEIKTTQSNLNTLGTTVSNNKKAFDDFTSDGYLDSSEIAAIAQDSKRLEDDYNAAVESYNNVVGSKFLLDKDGNETTYKTDLVSAKATLDSAKNELITYLSDIVSRYNASDSNGKATIKAAAAQKYTNFTNAYKAFYDKLGVANNYITSNLFDGLNTKLITNMAGLEYIKAALVDGDTVVKGGLILSTLIALRNDKGNVTAGINGADTKENGIAFWLGGKAIDKQASTTTEEEKKIAAKSLLRFDGTGYFANGNLWWDADGILHADPTSFIINKNNVGVQLALFAPIWKSGTTDTTKLANVLSIDPQKPFTHLDVSGNITTEGSLRIGGIYLSWDSENNALRLSKDAAGKEAANFYALGGITAYGKGAGTSGGGGLNGSVKSYSNALKLTSESLSEIASAYSIKALDSRISSLEGGSAMDVSVSGSGNAVTAISKSGTTIIVTKGTTFLTSHQSLASYLTKTDAASLYQPKGNYLTAHQSLDGYVNAIAVSGSGNAVTAVTKSGKTITFTKGSTFSLNGHTHTFASLTSKPTSLSGYGITDGVNAVSVTGSGNAITTASISGHTLTLTKGSSFSLSNHTHYVGTTQVQGSSAEQALTGITKIDNILKLSKASVTVNTSYKAEQNRLVIYGNTYGNDANYIKSAGKLSYGDGGPQLVFSTSENPDASGVQSAALVYTDHDTIGAGVSLSFVTNQGDAYFIAPHIKALTAFQGNLAWSYITNKPTTLSGFGITDGLRSVTQPSGSNVFVTGISTSGTAITYTKSYTKKSLSAVGTSGWTNASIDGNIIPDMSFIAYWNGAYSGTSSNLAYCNKGAFGSFAIKNSLAFSELTSKPTTISGYGITDAYTKSQVDTIAAKYLPLTGGTLTGQLKIEASALNGAYNGLRIGDDCYIGDCNFGNTIGLMGVGNHNAGMVKFGKGGMQFGYNGLNHIASTTAQWTNLNADLLDGWHKDNIVWSGAVNSNTASLSHYWAKLFDITVTSNQYDDRSFTFLFSNGFNDTYSVVVLRIRQNGAKDSGAYNFIISLRELVGNMSSRLRVYYNNATGNVQLWGNCQRQYGSLSYTIIKKTGRTSADFTSQGTLVTNTSFSAAQSLPATTGDSPYTLLDGATRIGIVNQADQLVTARTIWGQSFNGTANVSGALSGATTISASNTISTTLQNGALKIGNKLTPISAIDAQVIFNTGAAIRFGETNWDWNQWAGLKYTHSNKTIYLGIADKSVFTANSAQSNGTLKFPGITTITPDGGARIGGSGGDLYLGNANNSNWVKVQDICSQAGSTYWQISQSGNAHFNNIVSTGTTINGNATINGDATINGNLSVTGLISNKGILPANYEFNNKGAHCYVSAEALCSGITAITDSIQVNQVTVQYSNDSGNSWTNYPMSNDAKFNMYASNAGLNQVWLGYNVITGNNDAEKLAQVKKNELIVSFYISNSCYAQPYFASVDISNGIDTICTVDILNNSGAIVETYTKHMTGWNQINYISLLHYGNAGYGVGNNDRRYIRFRFKHDQKTTALRNTVINKIRIFSFTKYSFPTDRFMGHTGHIYNFDYNMNTYFPNSILAKGGVTAYQSSDIRLKQDLRKLDYLGIIKAMGGTYGFAWKKDNTRSIGWIAQHVLCNPHLKDIVETDEKGYYKINYWSPKLIATAFGAIEQVGDEVSRLKARVVFLESEVQRLSGDKEDCNKKRLDNKNINSLN